MLTKLSEPSRFFNAEALCKLKNGATSPSVSTGNATSVGLRDLLAPLCFFLPENGLDVFIVNLIYTSLQILPVQTVLREKRPNQGRGEVITSRGRRR